MPRQSNGQYIAPGGTTAVIGTTISPTAFNTLETDLGTEITNSVDRQGRSAMQAALPMGGYKITGMADPVALTDAATRNYVLQADQQNVANVYVNTGTSDALTCTCTPTITALTNGMTLLIRANAANTTVGPTFALDAIGALQIVKGAGATLGVGDIAGAGMWVSLTYDVTLNKWVLNNPALGLIKSIALASAQGLVVTNNAGTPNSKIDITADQAVMIAAGTPLYASAISVTIDTSVVGVINGLDAGSRSSTTWYNLHLISNGSVTAGLASLSATAPTLPSGYTYFVRVGAMRTDGSGNFYRTRQVGNAVEYTPVAATNTLVPPVMSNGSATTWTAVSVSNFAPPTATKIKVIAAGIGLIANQYIHMAPSNGYPVSTGAVSDPFNSYIYVSAGSPQMSAWSPVEMILQSSNIYWGNNAGGAATISAMGWTDKVNAS